MNKKTIDDYVWITDMVSIGRQKYIAREVSGPHGDFTSKMPIIYLHKYEITQYIYNGKDDKYVGAALWKLKEHKDEY